MDEALKAFLGELKQEIKTEINGLHDVIKRNADQSVSAHEATRRTLASFQVSLNHLWRRVEGSDPPPPLAGSGLEGLDVDEKTAKAVERAEAALPAVPEGAKDIDELGRQVTGHNTTIEALSGRMSSLEDEVKTVKEHVTESLDLQRRQTEAMGIKTEADTRSVLTRLVDGLAWMVKEREGQKFALSMFAAATGLVTAVGTTYAILTGRLPLPTAQVPAVQQPYAPPQPTLSLPAFSPGSAPGGG